jgi:hypothetical protein
LLILFQPENVLYIQNARVWKTPEHGTTLSIKFPSFKGDAKTQFCLNDKYYKPEFMREYGKKTTLEGLGLAEHRFLHFPQAKYHFTVKARIVELLNAPEMLYLSCCFCPMYKEVFVVDGGYMCDCCKQIAAKHVVAYLLKLKIKVDNKAFDVVAFNDPATVLMGYSALDFAQSTNEYIMKGVFTSWRVNDYKLRIKCHPTLVSNY